MIIRDALRDLRVPRIEARLLVEHALGLKDSATAHAWLIAHDTDALSDEIAARYESLVLRRMAGEPIAYLVGRREFYGRPFRTTPAALIPRPETELLIDIALSALPAEFSGAIVDVGTGTGCIAITLALERPQARVTALDVSADALALARENAKLLGASNAQFVESNWFSQVPAGASFDVIASNPPYIAPGDAHLSRGDLRFEPAIALADSVDGLESYRQLAQGAKRHLKPGGLLIVEHGFDQGESVPALFRDAGFVNVELFPDLAELPRVTCARMPQR